MDELKPCPFCGGKPTVNSRSNGYAEIGCEPCNVWTSSTNSDEHLQIWNHRSPAAAREAVSELPRYIDLFNGFELCHFDTGDWSLRKRLSDGDVAHQRYLEPYEANMIECAIRQALPATPEREE